MADTHERVEKIEELTKSSGTEATNEVESTDRIAPTKDAFDTVMNNTTSQPSTAVTYVEAPAIKRSLMDEVRDLNQRVESVGKTTTGDLVAQTKELISQMEEVKGKLAEPNLDIKDSVQTLLRNKLSHIDENLKIALNKAGVEYSAPTAGKLTNPIERFLGYLTHGQYQLQNLGTELEQLGQNREALTPARMLTVQIKVGFIQQELEFFTNLLNKSLESTKTIMNVQV